MDKVVEIHIHMPQRVYDILDTAIGNNRATRVDPTNPKRQITEPIFPSVEAWIENVVDQNVAPVLRQHAPPADTTALEAQMRELQAQIDKASKAVLQVTRTEAPVEPPLVEPTPGVETGSVQS
jgi:hypothetical protein